MCIIWMNKRLYSVKMHCTTVKKMKIVKTFRPLQCVELSYVHQCMNYRDGYVHSNWSSLYSSSCWKRQKVITIVLYNCTLPDDGSLRPETYRSLRVLRYFYERCSSCIVVHRKENVKFDNKWIACICLLYRKTVRLTTGLKTCRKCSFMCLL